MATIKYPGRRTGRNAPCPCGSGRKYKRCHLRQPVRAEAVAQFLGKDVLAAAALACARRLGR